MRSSCDMGPLPELVAGAQILEPLAADSDGMPTAPSPIVKQLVAEDSKKVATDNSLKEGHFIEDLKDYMGTCFVALGPPALRERCQVRC